MNLHENKQAFADAIAATANALNIKRHFVEKDYWICRSLQQMARTDEAHHAIFKGGTMKKAIVIYIPKLSAQIFSSSLSMTERVFLSRMDGRTAHWRIRLL